MLIIIELQDVLQLPIASIMIYSDQANSHAIEIIAFWSLSFTVDMTGVKNCAQQSSTSD